MKYITFISIFIFLNVHLSKSQNITGKSFVCLDGATYTWKIDNPFSCYRYKWSIIPKIIADSTKFTLMNGKTNETFQVQFDNGESLNATIKCQVRSKNQGSYCNGLDYEKGVIISFQIQVGYGSPVLPNDIIQSSPSTCGDVSPINLSGPQYFHANSYKWSLPDGWTANTLNAQNIVAYPNGDNGGLITYKVTYNDFLYNEECIDNRDGLMEHSSSKDAIFNTHRLSDLTINPDIELKFGDATQISFTANSSRPLDGANYFWSLPCGWKTTDGQNGSFFSGKAITVIPSGYTGGEVTVKAHRICDGQNTPSNILKKNYDIISSSYNLINGNKTVCESNTIFSISTQPDGTTTYWSVIPSNLFVVTNGTGLSFQTKAKAFAYGTALIKATISGACPDLVLTKSVTVGKPKSDFIDATDSWGDKILKTCETISAEADYYGPEAAITEFEWYLPDANNWEILEEYHGGGQSFRYVEIDYWEDPAPFEESIFLRAKNFCGWSNWKETIWYVDDCGGYFMMVSPNPADNYITVSFTAAKKASQDKNQNFKATDNIHSYEIILYDADKNIVKSSYNYMNSSVRINVQDLLPGIYYLHLITTTNIYKKRIVIE